VPPGFSVYRGEGFSFAHPRRWAASREPQQNGDVLIEVAGPTGAGGFGPQVANGYGPASASFNEIVELHKTSSQAVHSDYRVLNESRSAIDGARDAWVIEAEYLLAQPGGPPTRIRTINLLVLTEGGTQMNFFVRSPLSDFEASQLQRVFASFRLG